MEAEAGTALRPDRAVYTANDFAMFRDGNALAIAPKFQRRGVWTQPARAFFIDSLIRGLPVPPIYLRVTQSPDRKRTVREVIDGQQRVSALLDYVDNKYALTRSVGGAHAGKYYDELDPATQDLVSSYGFNCEVFYGLSDAEVLEVFARLNTYSVGLNAQELRNGRFFGFFKQSAYALAYEHLEFWRWNKIMSERAIARMAEAELTSELLILSIAGLQDKKTSIDGFYADYDEDFPHRERYEDRFRRTIDVISETFDDGLGETEFRRTPLFYSLFGAVHHRRFGVPGVQLATPAKAFNANERRELHRAVLDLSDVLDRAREDKVVSKRDQRFVNASLRQTDNIGPRLVRLEQIYQRAF